MLLPSKTRNPELYPYRHGLKFAFYNALNWQVVIGTPTVLFMQELRADSLQVGLVFAWTFLLTPVQVLATAFLPRIGFKQLTLFGWNTRAWFLLVPIGLAVAASTIAPAPWMVAAMVVTMFGYSFFRAIGAAALTTWLFHIVPTGIRGRYWATDQILAASAGLGILVLCALLFGVLPPFPAFFIQYSIAAIGALAAYRMLQRLPDVEKPRLISLEKIAQETPRLVFQPSVFRTYLWLSIPLFVAITPIPAFTAFFLKASGRATASEIMIFSVITYVGVIAANLLMRSHIDRFGAKPFFRLAYLGYGLAAAGWLILFHFDAGWGFILPALYFLQGSAGGFWTSSNLNYLAKILPEHDRSLPVSLHGAVITFLGGFSPVVWGLFLKSPDDPSGISIPVLAAFFVVLLLVTLALSTQLRRLPEIAEAAEPILRGNWILRPIRGLATIINLVEPAATPPPPPRDPGAGERENR
jgi:MFS family permease